MTQIIPPLDLKLLNAVRHLRAGLGPQSVWIGTDIRRAILQEIAGVDLGVTPLPEGQLTEIDLQVYRRLEA